MSQVSKPDPKTSVERLRAFAGPDLYDLCDATEAAILDGGGFGWLKPPARSSLENYWRGILLVPERQLFVARLDGTIAGSAQLLLPTSNKEAEAHCAWLTTNFLAPWARGFGLARDLVLAVEDSARRLGSQVLQLDVRETQTRALQIYEQLGYTRWGSNPRYSYVDGRWITGHYYYKTLAAIG